MSSDATADPLAGLRDGFAHPTPASRPMVRWWWFGPEVEREEIVRELDAMAEGGFGGAELSIVYPIGEHPTPYLSPEFLADVRFAAETARERGMRFDVTLGSGWSFGGPHITPELAARNLHWDRFEIGPAAASIPISTSWPGDELVAAYVGNGSLQERPEQLRLVQLQDGVLQIPAGAGPRTVYLAISRLTGQNVKRAAVGAEGPVFDHYSRSATEAHIASVAEPIVSAVGAELLGSVFCDSLEVYGADWTPDAVAEFARRRGYDPLPELYLLLEEHTGDESARFRRDMYRTLTELYEENFVVPLAEWAAGRGVPFRIQGYGEPPAAVSSYRFVDMIEGEGWGWKDVTQTRWASSAAHLYGHPVVSSETWTWVHSPSFRATPLDLRGEAHEHVLLGINHFVGHGWPYSPASADGIGWMFYASGALDDRNPWWPAMPALTEYLHRLAWLMRQGAPAADVAIYAPSSDAYADMHAGGEGVIDLWKSTRARIGDRIPAIIRGSGHDFDLIDDEAFAVVEADRYRALVLPSVVHLPESARRWVNAFEEAGGQVIAVGSDPRGNGATPGAHAISEDELGAALPEPPLTFAPACPEIGIVHRTVGDTHIYFVANTTGATQAFEVEFALSHSVVEQWDANTGRTARRWLGGGPVPLSLEGYEATVLIAAAEPSTLPALDTPARGDALRLDGPWTVTIDGSSRPVELPHRWEDDERLTAFSGSATYATTVDIPSPTPHAVLDFGRSSPLVGEEGDRVGMRGRSFRALVTTPIGEIAVVTVNGRRAGVVWGTPYSIDVGALLLAGENSIELTVFNTAANALAVDPTVAVWAAQAEARYGRRFRMQDLDHAADGVASGLLATPVLVLELVLEG